MTFTRTVAITALLLNALPWNHALGQPRPTITRCDNFDYLPAGKTYRLGNSFASPNSTATITQFLLLNGNPSPNGYAKVDTHKKSGGTRLDLWINNATVDFKFVHPPRRLTFRFGEYGGNLNVAVNGDFRKVANLADLHGQTVGGARLTVVNGHGNDKGTVTITGTVTTLRIGGQELWIDDLCPDIGKLTSSDRRAALADAYWRARAAEGGVTGSVIELDREARRQPADDSRRPQFSEHEKEVFALDTAVNAALKDSYRAAFGDAHPDADRDLVRTALLHWMSLLRRRSMTSLHTTVPGLVEDPRCRGDVISDELFTRYFDTLFDQEEWQSSERDAVAALADLARQSACLGERQSARLASDLYWSFTELRSYLRDNELQRLIPAVVQAAAAPMLLFYDVEKDRGPTAPLSRWFAENRDDLIDGAVTERIPIAWQGLWLYDRRTGMMLGFKAARIGGNQNHVNLPVFLDSITRFTHLGDYACTFAEMAGRGEGHFGYVCASSSCAKLDPRTPSDSLVQLSDFEPAFGIPDSTLKETVCKDGGGPGSGSGGSGGGNGPCGSGSVGGGGALSNVFQCVANLRMTSQQKFMQCFAEATGMCANPIDQANKKLQQTLYGGVPMGSGCQVSSGTGKKHETKPDPKTATSRSDVEIAELTDRDREALQKDVDKAQEKVDRYEAKIEDDKLKGNDKQRERDERGKFWADKDLSAKKQKLSDYDQKVKEAGNEVEKDMNKAPCPPDVPDCGGNQCTAMSAQTQAVLSCAEKQIAGNQTPEIPNDGVFDPPEQGNEGGAQLASCLQLLTPPESPNQCWAVKCANNRTTTLSASGDCGCGSAVPPGGLIGTASTGGGQLCPGTIDCPSDSRQEGCRCAPSGQHLGGGPVPGGADRFEISSPPLYSKVAGAAPPH